jgi:hypothetical protein
MKTEKSQVKSYIRDGKLVKSHSRVYKKKSERNYTRDLIVSNTALLGATGFGLTRKNKIFRNTVVTAAMLGRPITNYLILKARYEDNLKKSGKNIKEGKDIPKMRVTGLTPKPKKTGKPQLTFFFAGLSNNHAQVKEAYSAIRKSFRDEGFLNKTNLIGVTQEMTNRGKPKAVISVAGGNLVKGKNTDSEKIAKYIYDWKQKNPDAKINLIGHSGGGLTSKDVAYILHQTGINKSDLRNLTVGTPYLDIVPSKNPTRNVIIKEEFFNKITPFPIKNKAIKEIDLVAPLQKEKGFEYHYDLHLYPSYFIKRLKQANGRYADNPVYDNVIDNIKQFFGL